MYVWNGTDWVAVDGDADTTTKGLMGVALGTAATDGFLTHGVAYLSHDPGAAGDILYVDTVTPGYLTATQPSAAGDFVRVAGYCLADNKVFFSPSQDFIAKLADISKINAVALAEYREARRRPCGQYREGQRLGVLYRSRLYGIAGHLYRRGSGL